ncbi:MAG: LD-carboxypeptidase [Candidatus Binatia bacterium]
MSGGKGRVPDWHGAPRRPPALRPGDTIAVIAPASAADPSRIRRGARRLEALGFRTRVYAQAFARRGHFAGKDRLRAAALRGALADPKVRAVFFTRGGFGAARLLPLVEGDLRRAPPKILIGYSDVTSLLAFATGKLGWVTFHGPMVATDLPDLRPTDRASLLDTLNGRSIEGVRLGVTLRRGVAEGRLFGGCLSILVSLLGTPYAVDLADRILFLEDVNEEPYSLDRMLTQLRHTGELGRAKGIVFAEMANCGRRRDLLAVLHERTADLGVPVAFGAPSGHGRGKRTIPLGARVRLDATRKLLQPLEPAVSP